MSKESISSEIKVLESSLYLIEAEQRSKFLQEYVGKYYGINSFLGLENNILYFKVIGVKKPEQVSGLYPILIAVSIHIKKFGDTDVFTLDKCHEVSEHFLGNEITEEEFRRVIKGVWPEFNIIFN